ncbi:class I SAM-dependent methyltransferase [Sphingomonas qomolangmaensis]|uniref:Class I SAM-dependent methyltransferase n=1 Tax=Sphingomonas qomolangmaensis TaxID=2918765 RepID=A0ABY5L3A2_9SPHN|nr:class I SAM-dependent methyltransferase [Sphingomonas qomolangmaensis]UUL81430.1 class I SAM-dependent methyltransferase [Sphingomonas qomolangmaensis]
MSPIDLAGFDAKFSGNDDPWSTFTDRDEARKRRAILRGIGGQKVGRVLELAAGNGSNSAALARLALRLDATEGTPSGVKLVARAVAGNRRVRVSRLVLPGRFPRATYDAVVIAEMLYYLSPRDMAAVARAVAAALRPGGRLILAHHRVDYPDFVQHAAHIHRRFLAASGVAWRLGGGLRNGRWRVQTYCSGPST